jgi:superfamily II DNA helicase RecQ
MRITTFKIRLNDDFQAQDKLQLNEFLQNNHILQTTSQFVYDKEHYWSILLKYSEKNMLVSEPNSKKYESPKDEILNADEAKILESLKFWRSERAKEDNLPVYMIATNSELFSIAKFKPAKKEELIELKGFGEKKIAKYGDDILEILEEL